MNRLSRKLRGHRVPKDISDVLLFLCDHSHRVVPRRILRLLLEGRDREILNIHLNPEGYCDPSEFALDYAAINLVKKYDKLATGIDRRLVAETKYLEAEKQCTSANQRWQKGPPPRWEQAISYARRFIHRVLGKFSWDEVVERADHGPGASLGIRRRESHAVQKIAAMRSGTVTGCCVPLREAYLRFDPHLTRGGPAEMAVVTNSSTLTFVPKDARSDRAISVEPLWNMFFQKGIGSCIRQRLRVAGLDLNYGQDLNRQAARLGSIDGSLATIDLSSASDTVCYELVRYLLPEEWFLALARTRTPCVHVRGDTLYLRKFSSMGNGYTFELESLIFWALARSVVPRESRRFCRAYGDDIIIASEYSGELIDLLGWSGFSVNLEKSFVSGPFRESCGGHFFHGKDVTPFYIKEDAVGPAKIIARLNNWKRLAYRLLGFEYGLLGSVRDTWEHVRSLVPHQLLGLNQPWGPDDRGVILDRADARSKYERSLSCQMAWGLVSPQPRWSKEEKSFLKHGGWEALTFKLWASRRGEDLGVSSPSLVKGTELDYRVRKYPVERWSEVGPWVPHNIGKT